MERYDISKYYVGELYLHYVDKNNLVNQKKKRGKKFIDLASRGAIMLPPSYVNAFLNSKNYRGYLTVFYNTSDKNYICLHDGEKYSKKGKNFCKNLVPIIDFLPKVDYSFNLNTLSSQEARSLFRKLYYHNISYQDSSFFIEHYFVGNMHLCSGITDINSKGRDDFSYLNVPYTYLTFSSNAKFLGGFSVPSKDIERKYYYETYRCLFFKLAKDKFYNINNFQIYSKGNMNGDYFYDFDEGDNFYDCLSPLSSELKKYGVKRNYKVLSLSRALNLQNDVINQNKYIDNR